MRLHHCPLLVALTAATAVAQAVTLPPAATQWAGNLYNNTPFFAASYTANEARTQLLYPLADIPPGTTVIQQLAFRAIGTIANAAATTDLDISISTSPRNADDPSPTFAVNAPGPALQVFSGTVSLPASPTGSWPPPWAVQIPLQTAFPLAPAPGDVALVIDVRCRNNTGSRSWYVEQYGTVQTAQGQGTQILTQPSCQLPNGQTQTQSSFRPDLLHPGGRLSLTLGLYPNNQPSAAVNALVIGLRAQGTPLGGLVLPAPLSSFGVPAPPGCMWTVEPAMSAPMDYASYSWGGNLSTNQHVPIPNIAGLAGLRIYAQNVALMQYPTGLQLFPSVGMEFVIGDSITPSGGSVAATGNQNATTGVVSTAGPVSIELQ